MAKTKISEFSSTPGNNTDIDNINIAEGCAPSGINNAIRELMAQLKDWQSGTSNDPYVVGSSGSLTLSYGTANGVAYLNGSKVLTTGSALTFDGSQLDIPAGSAASPSLSTPADVNTGLYFPAADTIGLSTNGTERVRLDSSGNLGLGVTNPAAYGGFVSSFAGIGLHTNSTSGAAGLNLYEGGTGRFSLRTLNGSAGLSFFDTFNSSERARIDSSGNLGIGTSSPAVKLSVATAASTFAASFQGSSSTNLVAIGTTSFGASINGYTAGFATTADLVLQPNGGNLGLGVTPSAWQAGSIKVFEFGTKGGLAGAPSDVNFLYNVYYDGSNRYRTSDVANNFQMSGGAFKWFTAPSGTAGNAISFTQAMTLDSSGNLLVGTTSTVSAGKLSVSAVGGTGFGVFVNASGSGIVVTSEGLSNTCTAISFRTNFGAVGNISCGSTTAYNTSSDYRLKNTIAPMTGALAKVALLKPCTYKWKVDGSDGQGFIAHELAEVEPGCVTGEKDAVDAEGKPQYQGIDTSFLVATLTAAIQEQQALITSLTARVAALESN